jgi:hypothetical protein
LRQGLAIQSRLVSNLQSSCLRTKQNKTKNKEKKKTYTHRKKGKEKPQSKAILPQALVAQAYILATEEADIRRIVV